VGLSTYSKWLRWTVVLTEPILAPLRRLIPPLGMIDITPLVAFFILSLTRGLLLAAI
jgi:YggT family protein